MRVSTQLRAPRNGTVSELIDELRGSGPVLVTGEIDEDQAEFISRIDRFRLPPVPLRMRHPGAFAELAWRRWQAGDVDDAQRDRTGLPLSLIAVLATV